MLGVGKFFHFLVPLLLLHQALRGGGGASQLALTSACLDLAPAPAPTPASAMAPVRAPVRRRRRRRRRCRPGGVVARVVHQDHPHRHQRDAHPPPAGNRLVEQHLRPQFGHSTDEGTPIKQSDAARRHSTQHRVTAQSQRSHSHHHTQHTVTVQTQHTVTAQSQRSHSHHPSQHEASSSVMSTTPPGSVVTPLVEASEENWVQMMSKSVHPTQHARGRKVGGRVDAGGLKRRRAENLKG